MACSTNTSEGTLGTSLRDTTQDSSATKTGKQRRVVQSTETGGGGTLSKREGGEQCHIWVLVDMAGQAAVTTPVEWMTIKCQYVTIVPVTARKQALSICSVSRTRPTPVDTQGRVRLLLSPDAVKDQTYFLCALNQAQLQKALFPVGAFTKERIRELAVSYNLPTKNRKDSQVSRWKEVQY